MISGLPMMKVLVVKLSAIGDVIHTLPALEVLRHHLPESSLHWVVEEKAADILIGHPYLDKVMVSGRKRWIRDLAHPSRWSSVIKEAVSFIRELRKERYDLVIDFQGLFKSAVIVCLSRGACKAGYGNARELSYLAFTHKIEPPPSEAHAVDKNIALVHAILQLPEVAQRIAGTAKVGDDALSGFEASVSWMTVPGVKEQRHVEELLHDGRFVHSRCLILINVPAGWESKRWKVEHTAALADRLIGTYDAQLVYTGSAEDAAFIDGIIDRMRYPAVNAAGRTSLKELACLIKKARLLVSTDSGPLHLAAAIGTPVVGIFGPTAPWRTGPYTPRSRIVRARVPCSPCYKKHCDSMLCMKGIGVDEVMQAAEAFLKTPGAAEKHTD